jgi:hypothetical protein
VNKTKRGIEWFAGLFEGEGCIYRNDRKRILVMTIKMIDGDTIDNVFDTIGMGRVSTRLQDNNPNHKRIYEWNLTQRNQIMELCEKILPFMGKRRTAKIKEVLAGLKKLPPKRNLKKVKICGLTNHEDITTKGAKFHLKKGEKPCESCASANRNYLRKWRKAFFEANQ